MKPLSHSRSESAPPPAPVPDRVSEPRPWVRGMVAVLLRIGLGVSMLNGGLIGYLTVRRGGSTSSSLAWSTLLGPAAVAGVLEHDLLVPFVQIAIGLALILGFFTVVAAVVAGFLVLSGPIFQFLAILGSTRLTGTSDQAIQALVTTGSINLLLLVAAVLWLTPIEGTPWSLDALIFARSRHLRGPLPAAAAPGPAEAPPDESPAAGARPASLSASRGE